VSSRKRKKKKEEGGWRLDLVLNKSIRRKNTKVWVR
jgi:hypothetical protein